MVMLEAKLAPEHGASWKEAFLASRKALIAKYGSETSKRVRWPAGCQEAHEIVGCLEAATAHFRYEWSWDSGHGIVLAMGRKGGAGKAVAASETAHDAAVTPTFRVTFSSPAARGASAPAGL